MTYDLIETHTKMSFIPKKKKQFKYFNILESIEDIDYSFKYIPVHCRNMLLFGLYQWPINVDTILIINQLYHSQHLLVVHYNCNTVLNFPVDYKRHTIYNDHLYPEIN